MKHKHYDIKSARDIFADNGLILDDNNYVNTETKMKCHDEEGFKYVTSLSGLLSKRIPYKYSKFNPFTIRNIQMILDKETDGVKIISQQYHNSSEKLQFRCSCGNLFEMDNGQFVSGKRYCNFCAKSKRYDGRTDYNALIKEKCDKSGYILITNQINRNSDKVEYICERHKDYGVQFTTPHRMLNQDQGCRYCGIESRGIKHRIPIENIKALLDNKDFEYVNHDYVRYGNGSRKVRIHCLCNFHRDRGVQYLDYGNLKKNKVGCIYCKGQGRTKESLQLEFDNANKNITILEFSDYTDITVKCDLCGYVWDTKGVSINSGHGCPRCNMSNYEKRVERVLRGNNIEYIPQYKFNDCRDILPLPFDFYLPKYNILIEVDGQGHYKPINFNGSSNDSALKSYETTIAHDKIKTKYSVDNNINLIRIPYYDLDNKSIDIDKYILEKINI